MLHLFREVVFMRANVDFSACIGCGACEATCPAVFKMMPDGDKAYAYVDPVPAGEEDTVREARNCCPVDAIEIEE